MVDVVFTCGAVEGIDAVTTGDRDADADVDTMRDPVKELRLRVV